MTLVETARPSIDAKRHAFTVQVPRERIEFAADPMRLAQVLANLNEPGPAGARNLGLAAATGLPVWDFTTLIDWVYEGVVRREFKGFV